MAATPSPWTATPGPPRQLNRQEDASPTERRRLRSHDFGTVGIDACADGHNVSLCRCGCADGVFGKCMWHREFVRPLSHRRRFGDPWSSAGTSTPRLTKTFTSPTMGYTVNYPGDWTPTPATDLWLPSASNFWDDPVGDRLESSVAGFRGTSQLLAKGHPPRSGCVTTWLPSPPGVVRGNRSVRPVTRPPSGSNGCAGQGRLGGKVFDLILVSGNRGYNFTMEGKVDRPLLLAMLGTVKLDPRSAKLPK